MSALARSPVRRCAEACATSGRALPSERTRVARLRAKEPTP